MSGLIFIVHKFQNYDVSVWNTLDIGAIGPDKQTFLA